MKRTSWQIQRAVIFAIVVRELQTRFGGRLIGLFWVIGEPLIHIGVILLIRVVLRARYAGVMIDVAVYLVIAMIPFFTFRNIWFRVMEGAAANAGLFAYRQVKPADAFAARVIIECALYAMVLIALLAGCGWAGMQVLPVRPLEYILVCLLFALMGLAFGLITATTLHHLPAIRGVIRIISMPLYVMSGVLMPIANFPPQLIPYLLWNPLLHLVEMSRWAYFASYQPLQGTGFTYPVMVTFVTMGIGVTLYRLRRMQLLTRV